MKKRFESDLYHIVEKLGMAIGNSNDAAQVIGYGVAQAILKSTDFSGIPADSKIKQSSDEHRIDQIQGVCYFLDGVIEQCSESNDSYLKVASTLQNDVNSQLEGQKYTVPLKNDLSSVLKSYVSSKSGNIEENIRQVGLKLLDRFSVRCPKYFNQDAVHIADYKVILRVFR